MKTFFIKKKKVVGEKNYPWSTTSTPSEVKIILLVLYSDTWDPYFT